MLPLWRLLFAGLLLLTVVLAIRTSHNLNIDTNLADISPNISGNPHTKATLDGLNSNIEKRVILLIDGGQEDLVLDAEEALRSQLSALPGISVQADSQTLLETLVEQLKPYRFALLSEPQRKLAAEQSSALIAKQAQSKLYSLSAQAGLFSFADDPLGWHSETIISLLSEANSGVIPSQNNAAIINIVIDSDALNMRTQQPLTTALNREIQSVLERYPVNIEQSGVFFFAAQTAKSSKRDISLISIGSMIGVVLLLLFVFRSLRALVLPIVSIALGILFAFVVTHSWYGNVHILTIVFGATLIGIVIDYSLHFFYHGAGDNHKEEVSALYRALLLSLMTSLIGYAALSFSDLQALRKVATFSCCGLFMAWLSVVCLGDLALRKPLSRERKLIPSMVTGLLRIVRLLPSKIYGFIALSMIVIAGLLIVLKPIFSDDPRVFFTLSESLLASERKVAEVANDYEPGRYLIVNGASDEQIYERHAALFEAISGVKELNARDFTSLLNWVPAPITQQNNYQLQNKLYQTRGAAEQLITLLSGDTNVTKSAQAAYQNASNRYLTPTIISELLAGSAPPFWFESETQSSHAIINFVLIRKGTKTDALQNLVTPLEGVEFINTVQRTETALAMQRISASKLLILAYFLVALVIVARYRSFASLWLVMVPISSSAMLVILSAMFGFQLNLFHMMALFLVLGFGMDYTIFVREMAQHPAITLQAILLSAITSLLSFGLLSISAIPIVASFGLTLLIGNLFNLLGVMIYAQSQPALKPAINL